MKNLASTLVALSLTSLSTAALAQSAPPAPNTTPAPEQINRAITPQERAKSEERDTQNKAHAGAPRGAPGADAPPPHNGPTGAPPSGDRPNGPPPGGPPPGGPHGGPPPQNGQNGGPPPQGGPNGTPPSSPPQNGTKN